MKNIIILGIIVSFIEIVRVDPNSPDILDTIEKFLLVALPVVFIYYACKYYYHCRSIYFFIKINIIKLTNRIRDNQKCIQKLRDKVSDMKFKLYQVRNIDEEVKTAIENNLIIWEEQIDLHQRLIRICNTSIATLSQKKEEIRLLDDMLRHIKKEPKAEKRVKKMEKLMDKVDTQIRNRIPDEIKSLIKDLKTASRSDRIGALKIRVRNLEKLAS
jgi:cysteinyl-tRNA synthetase